ncbi:unnamed protein product [Macrosiphum euphorbiae]|uniref:Ubiquitin-like protease family profile domain-containing protein n=1 Tax=Macrosiphum euphorbiae TaxID=13131 RepID=A0AAV0Y3R5_9HEMI|nr:unnamed protein product [Macrosiphum euphorbiae]
MFAKIPVYAHNGLPKIVNYFKNINMPVQKKYTVSVYGDCKDFLQETPPENPCLVKHLTIEDFDTLSNNNWLNNYVIDACIDMIIKISEKDPNYKNLSFVSLSCGLVSAFSARVLELVLQMVPKPLSSFDMFTIETNTVLGIPINIEQIHWLVAFINFKTLTCVIMDPKYSKNEQLFNTVMTVVSHTCKFGKGFFLQSNGLPILNLQSIDRTLQIPIQIDNYNCGVYILYYVQIMIMIIKLDIMKFTAKQFNNKFKPSAYL